MAQTQALVALGLLGSCDFQLTCYSHSFNKYLYSTFSEVGSVLDAGKKAINLQISAQVNTIIQIHGLLYFPGLSSGNTWEGKILSNSNHEKTALI